ncbi:MAG: hypothetical protein GXP32_07005 [Kiritimatiellaeota bacterium]|nr:hypothetical protein [Kiritimatiellota bacterium]
MGVGKEIRDAVRNFSGNAARCSAEFAFSESFIGFQGHFPGKPVLPGVCQIEMALAVLEKAFDRGTRLKKLNRGKFLNMVAPNETVSVAGSYVELADNMLSAKFALTKRAAGQESDGETVNVSRLSLTVELV